MDMKLIDYQMSELIDDISMGPFGSNIKTDCYTETGVPYLTGKNMGSFELVEDDFYYVSEEKADSLGRSVAKRGDVIVTHRGTIGQIAYIPMNSMFPRYVTGNSQFRFSCNGNVLPEYIVYYFHTPIGQYELLSNASQVGVPALARPTTSFQKLRVSIPDINTQRKIMEIILVIERKIQNNIHTNDNLLQQAMALYGQFSPYSINDSLPKGWRVGTVADIVEIHDSRRIPLSGEQRAKMVKRTYPYYGAASLMDFVDEYIFDGVYLLLGEDGTVVDAAGYPILQYVWGQFWVNNHAHILTGKEGFSVESLMLFFKKTSVKSIVTGAVQPKISQANLKSIPVVIPPLLDMESFNKTIQPLFNQIRQNHDQNKVLASLRDTLLPKLMFGEIDVTNITL